MLTTYYASEKLELDGVFPFGGMEEIQRKLSLELYSDMRVRRVDTAHRSIELEGGQMRGFDAILIATGASALVPGPLRRGSGDFFLMRTLNDAQRLRRRLEQGGVKRAVVVGGSMVGIKVAELLYRRGVEVTLADGAPYLFPLAAYESTAHAIQQRLEERGLDLIFRAQVSAVTPKGVTLADGRTLEADLVCLCIGTRANVELVANTQVLEGENVQIERGIVVDEGHAHQCPRHLRGRRLLRGRESPDRKDCRHRPVGQRGSSGRLCGTEHGRAVLPVLWEYPAQYYALLRYGFYWTGRSQSAWRTLQFPGKGVYCGGHTGGRKAQQYKSLRQLPHQRYFEKPSDKASAGRRGAADSGPAGTAGGRRTEPGVHPRIGGE